jgi:hypothetical protein
MDKNISILITDICNKHGIKYSSVNKEVQQLYKDAKQLSEIYFQLRNIMGKLKEIGQRHNIKGLGIILEDDINKLENIEHDIMKIVKQFQELEKLKENK